MYRVVSVGRSQTHSVGSIEPIIVGIIRARQKSVLPERLAAANRSRSSEDWGYRHCGVYPLRGPLQVPFHFREPDCRTRPQSRSGQRAPHTLPTFSHERQSRPFRQLFRWRRSHALGRLQSTKTHGQAHPKNSLHSACGRQ